MATLLIIDDKAEEFSKSLDVALQDYSIRYAADAEEGLRRLEEEEDIACVLLDIRMPPKLGDSFEQEGMLALEEIRRRWPHMPVIMLTASEGAEDMVRAIRMGAFHYIIKPPDTDRLRTLVSAAIANRQLKDKVSALERTVRMRDEMESAAGTAGRYGRLVGSGAAMRRVFGLIEKLSGSDVPVLIMGESGTGKELVAREIHDRSPRAENSFIPVNCANLEGTLLESELFGHRKGAFTGATSDREGAFRAAEGGSLLLDEIAEMSPDLQAKLLRVLQNGVVKPVGADRGAEVDVRVIAATNRDIGKLVEKGNFREDLYYRLNVVRIFLPPLRERREDIPVLAEHFVAKHGSGEAFLGGEALGELTAWDWPGNVRQLENVIRRALVLSDGPEIEPRHCRPGQTGKQGSAGGYEGLWEAVKNGETTSDIKEFADLHGKLALADMMRRASATASSEREAGQMLGFIPENDPKDRAFNNYRSWKRRVLKIEKQAKEEQE